MTDSDKKTDLHLDDLISRDALLEAAVAIVTLVEGDPLFDEDEAREYLRDYPGDVKNIVALMAREVEKLTGVVEALKFYLNGCDNEQCMYCEQARIALARYDEIAGDQ